MKLKLPASSLVLLADLCAVSAAQRIETSVLFGPTPIPPVTQPQFGHVFTESNGLGIASAIGHRAYGPRRGGTVYRIEFVDGLWQSSMLSLPVVTSSPATVGGNTGRSVFATGNTLLIEERSTFLSPLTFRGIHVFERIGRDWAHLGLADLGAPFTADFSMVGAARGAVVIHSVPPSPITAGVYELSGLTLTPSGPYLPNDLLDAVPPGQSVSDPEVLVEGADLRLQFIGYSIFTGIPTRIAVRELRNGAWEVVQALEQPFGLGRNWIHIAAATPDWLAIATQGTGSETLDVYRRDPVDGQFTFHSALTNPNPFPHPIVLTDAFGYVAAFEGDRLVVGAYRQFDPVAGTQTGGAYLFRYDPAQDRWALEDELRADASRTFWLGRQVGFIGGAAVVTDPFALDPTGENTGAVYIYEDDFQTERCTGTVDAAGQAASLTVTGHNDIETGGLRLEGRNLSPGQNYAVLASLLPGPTALPGIVDHDLCIGLPRLPIQNVGVVDAAGATLDALNGGEAPLAALDPSEPLYLQLWFRRPPGSSTPAGVTNGVRVDLRND